MGRLRSRRRRRGVRAGRSRPGPRYAMSSAHLLPTEHVAGREAARRRGAVNRPGRSGLRRPGRPPLPSVRDVARTERPFRSPTGKAAGERPAEPAQQLPARGRRRAAHLEDREGRPRVAAGRAYPLRRRPFVAHPRPEGCRGGRYPAVTRLLPVILALRPPRDDSIHLARRCASDVAKWQRKVPFAGVGG